MVANGRVGYDQLLLNGRYPVGTRASFTCGQLYYPIGSHSSTCGSSGNWDRPTLICEGDVMFCFFCLIMSDINVSFENTKEKSLLILMLQTVTVDI